MSFRGITFSAQNVTPKNDGGLYASHYGDGVLWGCGMTIGGDNNDSLVIDSGEFIACGRVCQVDGATLVDLSTRTLTNGYIQIVMDYDLSRPEGEQWNIHTPLIESGSISGFGELTKEDLNDTGVLYQIELAIVQISAGDLSVYSTLSKSMLVTENDLVLHGDNLKIHFEDGAGDPQGVFASEDDSYLYIGKQDNTGAIVSGVRISNTGNNNVILYGHGGYVVFRPKGVNDSSGQGYIDADGTLRLTGDIRRTAQTYDASRLNSLSISGTTNTKICETTVVEAGVYLINVYCRVNMSGGGFAYTNIYKASSASSPIVYDLHYLKSGYSYITTTTWATFGANAPISFWVEPSGSCTVDSAYLYLIRIA